MKIRLRPWLLPVSLGACLGAQASDGEAFYGTREAFASDAIYFVMTDRFVNGDPGNDQRDQGGDHPTFDRPVELKPGELANIGYLGGDFKGVLDNAGYIHDLGFNAVWITPIVDNPDQAFTGSKPIASGSIGTDQGKTGYHGYWGVNFYKLDEHLPSPGLDFAGFTRAMQAQDLKVVLDIVANHGSPAYSMPVAQPMFGQIYDADGKLVADHQNLRPGQLDPARQPLHRFYNTRPGLAELSDTNENNPDVLDYFVGAYEQWIDQGAAAFRVDTIRWMPHDFWKQFADRIRARHPDFFMFGENFDYDAATIAPHTWARNGHISVLDFPMKKAMAEVFESPGSDYARLAASLYLEDGPYANPYDLVTFYDNHDMARLNASDQGFIDANNWLFTARGIPALYYGSETGFMRGRGEHAGNRNYYGQQRIDDAARSPIYAPLKRIANLRRDNIALQRGLQLDVSLEGDQAVFYRVYQQDDQHQIALVLLNKGDASHRFEVEQWLQSGSWRDGFSGKRVQVDGKLQVEVPGHDVRVLLLDQAVTRPDLKQRLQQLMARKVPKAD